MATPKSAAEGILGRGIRRDRRHIDDRTVDELLQALGDGGDSDLSGIESDGDDETVGGANNTEITSENSSSDEENEQEGNEQSYSETAESEEDRNVNRNAGARKKKKTVIRANWKQQIFPNRDVRWKESIPSLGPYDEEMPTPFQLFSEFYSDNFFETVAEMTNLYSIQSSGTSVNTNALEMRNFFAIHIIMGSLGFPQIKLYWNSMSRIKSVADNMTLNRFYALRSSIHVVNNLTDKEPTNRLWKVQPMITRFLSRCQKQPFEECLCVDEEIVPFKGQLSIKQYIPSKPTPWGIKLFLLCGKSGLVYDLLPYQGSTTQLLPNLDDGLGIGGKVVMTLIDRVPEQKMYKLYFDNFFSSIQLMSALENKGIAAAGTIRANRTHNCPIPAEREMTKKERGTTLVFTDQNSNLALTIWRDSKTVRMISNYVSKGQEDIVERWDKKNKKFLQVYRPQVMQHYNSSMGGVDKMDALISFYRIAVRSRKWPQRMIFHFIDLANSNSWLLYRQIATVHKIPEKRVMPLLNFRLEVAESLQKVNIIPGLRKRGRPSLNSPQCTVISAGCKARKITERIAKPCSAVRYDSVGHFPILTDKKLSQRCALEKCSGKTRFMCEKCQKHLCLTREKNCFKMFHVKE